MKQLQASIKTFNLDHVKEALARLGVRGMTVSQVRTVAGTGGPVSMRRGVSTADFLPRVKVLVVVPDGIADKAAEVLAGAT